MSVALARWGSRQVCAEEEEEERSRLKDWQIGPWKKKEKKDFPSWYRVTHPPDENGMLKQIVGPKKKV